MKRFWIPALTLAFLLQPACAATPQALLRLAIEAGLASGTIDGPVAEETRKQLNATGELTLAVTRVYRFEQAGCARLQLDFTQAAALLPGSTVPAPYSWSTQMSICADGYPPTTLKRRD
jgi:hypothetical protein